MDPVQASRWGDVQLSGMVLMPLSRVALLGDQKSNISSDGVDSPNVIAVDVWFSRGQTFELGLNFILSAALI